MALRNPEKHRDPLRTKTAGDRPYGTGSPRSRSPLKGLRTAEAEGSTPFTSTSSHVLAQPSPASAAQMLVVLRMYGLMRQ